MNAAKEKRRTNKKTWPLRPPSDVVDLVVTAMGATGKARQSLIFECIRDHLPEVVEKHRKRQQEAAKSFGKIVREKGKG